MNSLINVGIPSCTYICRDLTSSFYTEIRKNFKIFLVIRVHTFLTRSRRQVTVLMANTRLNMRDSSEPNGKARTMG